MKPPLDIKPMIRALYKRIFLPYQAILSFIVRVYIFVADIHLRPDHKEGAAGFISWLLKAGADADKIYILGDLFDYWYTGLEERFHDVIEALRSPKVHLMTGNRDFLLRNCDLPGVTVIHAEEIFITLGTRKVLLAHGHTLTEDDTGFKLLHRFGWPMFERIDRWLKPSLKERLARTLVRSSAAIRPLSAEIRPNIEDEKGVDTVICGHLHRYIKM